VIVVSSYLPEVLGLADRVLVMREGSVAGELQAQGATEEDVLRLASIGGPASSHESTTAEETGA
jgi:ABC-type sugar transport system ATPase subunit